MTGTFGTESEAEHEELFETIERLREYLKVMADEPKDSLILLRNVYHNLRRIIGDE